MLARAPCVPANSLIRSVSYPRSASNIASDFKSDSSSVTSRLSWASPAVTSRRTGNPLSSIVEFLVRDEPDSRDAADMSRATRMTIADFAEPSESSAICSNYVAGQCRLVGLPERRITKEQEHKGSLRTGQRMVCRYGRRSSEPTRQSEKRQCCLSRLTSRAISRGLV